MTLFSKIISGEIPSYRIAEDDQFFAFLDIFPAIKGHTLVVPKTATDRLFDLSAADLSRILTFAQPIANAIRNAFAYDRVNILTLGFEVPHAHIHLLPMNDTHDMARFPGKTRATAGELEEVQRAILRLM